MKKVIVKGSWIAAAVALMAIADVKPARAEERLVATVPFDFIVAKVRMPAGKYIISTTTEDPGILSVASPDGAHAALVLTISTPEDDKASQPGLIFTRFNGQFFLSRVVEPSDIGQEVPLSPEIMERELSEVSTAQ